MLKCWAKLLFLLAGGMIPLKGTTTIHHVLDTGLRVEGTP